MALFFTILTSDLQCEDLGVPFSIRNMNFILRVLFPFHVESVSDIMIKLWIDQMLKRDLI